MDVEDLMLSTFPPVYLDIVPYTVFNESSEVIQYWVEGSEDTWVVLALDL